jgi:hypothetical protein
LAEHHRDGSGVVRAALCAHHFLRRRRRNVPLVFGHGDEDVREFPTGTFAKQLAVERSSVVTFAGGDLGEHGRQLRRRIARHVDRSSHVADGSGVRFLVARIQRSFDLFRWHERRDGDARCAIGRCRRRDATRRGPGTTAGRSRQESENDQEVWMPHVRELAREPYQTAARPGTVPPRA